MKAQYLVYTIVSIIIFNLFACNKEKMYNHADGEINAAQSSNAVVNSCGFAYPDSIFYPSDYSANYEIRPVKRLAGTFGAYPNGLEIDEANGDIEIGHSETGLKYLVWYVPTGSRDTCKIFITVSGVNYPDSIYSLTNTNGIATPLYNGSFQQPTFCDGTCEFDDGHDDDNGNGFADEPPAGQELIPQGVSMNKANGSINLKKTILNGAALSAITSPGTFKDYILNYRLSDHSSKALNKMTLRLYFYQNRSQIPAGLKRDLAEKRKYVLLNYTNDPYSVSYTVDSKRGQNIVATREREVKCRPPYIIVVQK
jgi:hypothetical protein